MANKKKNTKSVTKTDENKEKVIKTEKEEKLNKKKDLEEVIDDEDLDIVDEVEEDNEDDHVEVVESFDLNNEIKGLKILTCVSICIAIVSLLISLIILSKVSNGTVSKSNSSDTANDEETEYDVSMFKSISYDEFMDMYKEDEEYFVFTGRSTCGYCIAFLPYLQQSVEEYDYTLYYLDMDTLTNSQISDVAEMDDMFATTFGATPMVYLIKDKEVLDVNQGYTDYETYAKFLEDNDVDKK